MSLDISKLKAVSVGNGPITQGELIQVKQYKSCRSALLEQGRALKDERRVSLGAHFSLLFEDRVSVWLQIQEELQWIDSPSSLQIQSVLEQYNLLVPGPEEFRCTLFLDSRDPVTVEYYALNYIVSDLKLSLSINGQKYEARSLDGHQAWLSAVNYLNFKPVGTAPNSMDNISWLGPQPYQVPLPSKLRASLMRELNGEPLSRVPELMSIAV